MYEFLLVKLAKALQRAGIPYMVIGGQAVLQYGEPRLTRDIDITLGVDIDELAHVLSLTQENGLAPAVKDVAAFAQRTNVLPVTDTASGVRVDLVFSFSPYEQEAIRRAQTILVGDQEIQYASVEDIIVHKIVAGRPRDLEDVKGIVVRRPQYDVAYVDKWLKAIGDALTIDLIARRNSIS
jgi:predicted nucleotidyltransferase